MDEGDDELPRNIDEEGFQEGPVSNDIDMDGTEM